MWMKPWRPAWFQRTPQERGSRDGTIVQDLPCCLTQKCPCQGSSYPLPHPYHKGTNAVKTFSGKGWANIYSLQMWHQHQTKETNPFQSSLMNQGVHAGCSVSRKSIWAWVTLQEFPLPLVTSLLKSPAPPNAAPAKILPFWEIAAAYIISERLHESESCRFLVSFHGCYISLPLHEEMLWSIENRCYYKGSGYLGERLQDLMFLSDMSWACWGAQDKHSTGLQLWERARDEHKHFKATLGLRKTTERDRRGGMGMEIDPESYMVVHRLSARLRKWLWHLRNLGGKYYKGHHDFPPGSDGFYSTPTVKRKDCIKKHPFSEPFSAGRCACEVMMLVLLADAW